MIVFLRIVFDIKPVYGDSDKYIKTKINIYGGNVNTKFQGKKNYKRKSTMEKSKKYYPQTLMEEWKYELKKIKIENLVDGDFKKSSSDDSDNEADNDSNDETESDNDNDESNE